MSRFFKISVVGRNPRAASIHRGLAKNISYAKHAAIVQINVITRVSSTRKPRPCSASTSNTSRPVSSTPGKGSTFTLYLPLNFMPAAAANALRPVTQTVRTVTAPEAPQEILIDDRESINRGDAVVLIVEDDPRFSEILLGMAREALGNYGCRVPVWTGFGAGAGDEPFDDGR